MSDEDRQDFSGWMSEKRENSGCALFFIFLCFIIVFPVLMFIATFASDAPNSPKVRNELTSPGDVILGVLVVTTLLMIWRHVSKK